MKESLPQILRQAGLVHHEPVRLRVGEVSDYYFDIKKGYGNPELLAAMAYEMKEKINERSTVIAAAGYGGIPLAAVLALELGKNLALVRDEEKKHGMGGLIDGYTPDKTDVISIVDDVFTTGSSLRQTLDILNDTGAEVEGCYVVVKRGEGPLPVPLTYLMTAESDNTRGR